MNKPVVKTFSFFIFVVLLCLSVWFYGEHFYLETEFKKYIAIGIIISSSIIYSAVQWGFHHKKIADHREENKDTGTYPDKDKKSILNNQNLSPILATLKSQYGTFWHAKVSIQLLLGSHSAVEKLAPSLTQEIWQECDGTLLIYGGDIGSSMDAERLETLKQLRRRRPLDGVIWVTENSISSQLLDNNVTFTNLNTATAHNAGRAIQNLFQEL
ncbi:MAG: ImcF-related family protein, partial [Providencia rustigianii]